jgi:hypothetical protein
MNANVLFFAQKLHVISAHVYMPITCCMKIVSNNIHDSISKPKHLKLQCPVLVLIFKLPFLYTLLH